jgi:hypothetical protein
MASKVAHNRPRPFYFTVQPRPQPTAQNQFFILWNLGTRHLFSYLWFQPPPIFRGKRIQHFNLISPLHKRFLFFSARKKRVKMLTCLNIIKTKTNSCLLLFLLFVELKDTSFLLRLIACFAENFFLVFNTHQDWSYRMNHRWRKH